MKYYIIDAFTAEMFQGNPAGVCCMEEELSVRGGTLICENMDDRVLISGEGER